MENFLQNPNYSLFFVIILLAIFGRYLVMSFVINKYVLRLKLAPVLSGERPKTQAVNEIKNSLITSVIFSFGFVHLYYLVVNGKTLVITNSNHSFGYHLISIILALLLHETYYYWIHRLMHQPKFYKYFHRAHHQSIIVSAWTSFSFDPLESILQLLFFYLLLFTIPIHLYSLLFLLIFMTISAIINHLNYEIYPTGYKEKFPFKLFIGATHHALHHKEFKTNYGLYFTFWDKIMGTESTNYKSRE